jgi:hypothetical protein
MTTVVKLARRGNLAAARLVLERERPARNGAPVKFKVPKLQTPADVVRAIASVVESAGKGELSLEEASSIAGLLDAQRRAIETTDIEARLAAVEARQE